MSDSPFLDDARMQFGKIRELAERALAQVDETAFFTRLDPETNSPALIVKHLAGNLASRWTDFLTSDGEKPTRRRDAEFECEEGDTRAALMARWDAGWQALSSALEPLTDARLESTVTIRGEAHSVRQAVSRQLTHYAYHVGQLVLLARHFAGPRWVSLSIPRGESKRFEVAKDGTRYLAER